MRQLRDILTRSKRPGSYVLGTVVDVEGSSYRKPGARELINENGSRTGLISGGCLEKDVVRHAFAWTDDGPQVVLYDTRGDKLKPQGDYGTGCDGLVHLLLERWPAGPIDPLAEIERVWETGESAVLATAVVGEEVGARGIRCRYRERRGGAAIMIARIFIAAAFLSLVWPSTAAAQAEETDLSSVTVGYGGAWYLMGGATGGGSFGPTGRGGVIGGELSVAKLELGWWYGVYTDVVYDFGVDNVTLTAGPEFGYQIVGFDGGVGVRPAEDGGLELGPQVRGLLTFGLLSFYVRRGFWPDATRHRNVWQVGAMFKIPLRDPWGMGPSAGWDMGERTRNRE